MGNFFETIYRWFKSCFTTEFLDFLSGKGFEFEETYNYLILLGAVTFVIALVFALIYYFIPKVSFNKLWVWFVFLLFTLVITGIYGGLYVKYIEKHMGYPNWVVYGRDNVVPENEKYDNGNSSEYEEYEDEYDGYDEESIVEGMSESENIDGYSNGNSQLVPKEGSIKQVSNITYIVFGIVNALVGAIFFIVLSIILKRFSVTCKNRPWKSLWPKK